MDATKERPDVVEGLRLIRAFLSLPPDKRAEIVAFVEELVRAYRRSDEEGANVPPR